MFGESLYNRRIFGLPFAKKLIARLPRLIPCDSNDGAIADGSGETQKAAADRMRMQVQNEINVHDVVIVDRVLHYVGMPCSRTHRWYSSWSETCLRFRGIVGDVGV